MARRRRSPREEKLLSYTRDRRNRYGENDKSSRRNIRRAKRKVVRRDRRAQSLALAGARGAADAEAADAAQERYERERRPRWSKWRDESLWVEVLYDLERRAAAEGGGASARRAGRVRSRLRAVVGRTPW